MGVQVAPVAAEVRELTPLFVGGEVSPDVWHRERAQHLGVVIAQRHLRRALERGDDAGYAVPASQLQDARAAQLHAVVVIAVADVRVF